MSLRRGVSVSVVCVVAALILSPVDARAIAIWPSMVGSWSGVSESMLLPAVQLPYLEFGVTRQVNGRFMGEATLAMADGSVRFICDGSVQPSPEKAPSPNMGNVVNVFGISTDGGIYYFFAHGKTRNLLVTAPSLLGDGSVRLAALQYEVFDLLGNLVDSGITLQLQRFGGLDWNGAISYPNVSGSWDGSYSSDAGQGGGRVLADLQSIMSGDPAAGGTTTSGFLGNLRFGGPDGELIGLLDVQGTVGVPAVQMGDGSLASPFGAVGQDSQGIIAVLIGLLLPAVQTPGVAPTAPQLQGNYMLLGNLKDVYDGFWRGMDTSFDRGSFIVTWKAPVPGG